MKIQFLGATREVTGSKHLITTDSGHTILLDCGMYQGKGMETDAANRDLGFDPAKLDCVVLSHAHIDHSGLIPYIVKMGFKGDIYCTPATRDLCSLMLTDTAFIQEQDVRTYNKKIDKQNPHKEKGKKYKVEPLYTQNDVNRAMKHFVTYSYDRRFRLFDDVLLTFTNSGHMLGGAICSLEIYEEDKEPNGHPAAVLNRRWKRLTYTGDVGRLHCHILPPHQLPPAENSHRSLPSAQPQVLLNLSFSYSSPLLYSGPNRILFLSQSSMSDHDTDPSCPERFLILMRKALHLHLINAEQGIVVLDLLFLQCSGVLQLLKLRLIFYQIFLRRILIIIRHVILHALDQMLQLRILLNPAK